MEKVIKSEYVSGRSCGDLILLCSLRRRIFGDSGKVHALATNNTMRLASFALLTSGAVAFTAPHSLPSSSSTSLSASRIAPGDDIVFSNKVQRLFDAAPKSVQYDIAIKLTFPGALNYETLEKRIVEKLGTKGFTPDNTLLATSLCCDELARNLEKDLAKVYGKNFNLGGLAGFPFGGNTAFGA